jgi:hypothetical protein
LNASYSLVGTSKELVIAYHHPIPTRGIYKAAGTSKYWLLLFSALARSETVHLDLPYQSYYFGTFLVQPIFD